MRYQISGKQIDIGEAYRPMKSELGEVLRNMLNVRPKPSSFFQIGA